MHKIGEARKQVDYECEVNSDEIRQRMKGAMISCMREYPFYGTIVINYNLIEVPDDHWVKTAAVDNANMYYNKHFINALDKEEVLFLFAHEVLHVVLKHLSRRGNREAMVWNQAGDFVINRMLVEAGVGKFPSVGGLYDEAYINLSTDKVYDIIFDKDIKDNNFDQHFDIVVGENSPSDGDGDGSSQQISMSQEDIDALEQDIDAKIIQAMDNANRSDKAGQVPGAIQRMIGELTTARVPWRKFIAETATSQIKSDYSWSRPNRRYAALGIIVPSITTENHFEFTIGVDTSGSISTKMLEDFISEIYWISRSFKSFNIKVFQYDTKVYAVKDFNQNNINEMLEYKITGGGGTSYDAAYEYFKEVNHKPRTYINFTDGYPYSSWGDEDYCKTIFIIHDESAINSKIKSPFGTTLYYSDF